jgi:FdhE protein
LDAARTRWAQVSAEQPAVRAALPLNQALLTAQIELLGELRRPATPSPDEVHRLAATMSGGVPAFEAEPAPRELDATVAWLPRFADALSAGGAGAAAARVSSALSTGAVDPHALLTASWRRDPDGAAALVKPAGLNLQVSWLLAELVSAPLAHLWEETRLSSTEPLRDAIERWDRGECPACGAWPSLAEFFLGERLNRCAYCAAAWPLSTVRCTYCGESGDDFRIVVANPESTGRRLEVCRACGGYLKTIDVERSIPFPLLAIEDLASQDLDRAAQHHGFRRRPLRTRNAERGTRN